jgi:hypothetical protein
MSRRVLAEHSFALSNWVALSQLATRLGRYYHFWKCPICAEGVLPRFVAFR